MNNKDMISKLRSYLFDTLGIEITLKVWKGNKTLPFFLRNSCVFYEANLLETTCLFVLDQRNEEQSPDSIRKQIEQVQNKHSGVVVYTRDRITSYNRKRLIDRKISFVVPGNQMYLPVFGVDLREHFKALAGKVDKFTPSAQALVIYLLFNKCLTGVTPSQMAPVLGYSAMTMTRAFDELENAGIGVFSFNDRKRILTISEKQGGQFFWEKALPFLSSPVKKEIYIEQLSGSLSANRAGLTALSNYSMLATPDKVVVAIDSADWKAKRGDVDECPNIEQGAVKVELWKYNPDMFARENTVDPLSLYLSLRDDQDERVEAALEEMMEKMEW
ncbi:MAG: hypothetical protein ACYTFY_13655 [Planctomycetota bacterium]